MSKTVQSEAGSLNKTAVNASPRRIPHTDSASTINVFVGGKKRKDRRNLLDAVSDTSKSPKLLNYHKRRLIEKGLRDKEGVTPPSRVDNERPALGPIQSTARAPNIPDSGRGTFIFQGSMDRSFLKSRKKKKKVHWEDDIIVQIPQTPDELESPVAGNELSDTALKVDIFTERALDESAFNRMAPINSLQPISSCNRSIISKICRFGSHGGWSGTLKFSNFDLENIDLCSYFLEGIEPLVFCHICTLQDLLTQTGCITIKEMSICQGTTSCSDVDKNGIMPVAKRLQTGRFGTVCYQNDFCILIFHASSRALDWTDASHDTMSSSHEDLGLGFSIFKPSPLFMKSMLAPIAPLSAIAPNFIPDGLGAYDFFFGSTYKDLVLGQKDSIATNDFFLVFPPSDYHLEAALISQWLQEISPNCKVKSSLQPGQWFQFSMLGSGIIIIHEDVLWTIPSLPQLSELLHHQNRKFECFVASCTGTFGQKAQQIHHPILNEGNYHLTQIFSQGTVILLTPSFVVSQPEQAYNFLKWFWQHYTDKGKKYRPKKLAVCSNLCEWLFDLALDKNARMEALDQCDPDKNARARAVQALLKCYNLVQYMIGELEDFEEGFLINAPDIIDGNDEQSLVNWFGSWAMLHVQQFRKFLVLGSSCRTEEKMSRAIRPVQFLTCCTENLSYQEPPAVDGLYDLKSGDDVIIPQAMLAAKVQKFLTDTDRSYEDLKFSPLVLYRSLVTRWDPETTLQLGDYKSYFKNYDDWLNHFKEPFFSRSQDLRPWIAIYRPANIHIKPWKRMELLIWDPYVRNHVFKSNGFCEAELSVAQEGLVSYITEMSKNPETTLPLERVWIGPLENHQDDGFVDPFDCVLSWVKTISGLVKERLPLSEKQLSSRGWTVTNIDVQPLSAVESNVSRLASEGPIANEQRLPLRTVFPAPRSRAGIEKSTMCNNHLQKAILRQNDSNMIHFTFQPTLKWYGEQMKAGRGLQHINVLNWQSVFAGFKIPFSED
ncbi:hypothetical protein ED733_006949 [Metarhizium rileyi]|uniref:Chromo domain-containing protein n=1 Tax=Metarhizium rileyi (strain RCEF 4871) TaxID=1649241 RepID=A0A5C6GF90_METRR|nr:hypothetical protein ED733_006949 [Metarhizium rileyi]